MSARSMNIVTNLPYIDECGSNHQYTNLHMKQSQITPTLCSKSSSTTKYFCSTEPVKKIGHWKKASESTILMDIESYELFRNTCCYAESLGVQYPLNKLKLQVFKSPNFGFKDTSSLAVASKYKMWSLHQKDFLEETYKLYPEERDQVTEIPKKAVIDDILILSSLYD